MTNDPMIPCLYSLSELQHAIAASPDQWRPLVFTNGCFDLLHAGHVRYLRVAKSLGRSLVVGLNSDQSVKTIKPNKPGFPPRPLVPEAQRAEVLATLKPVDGIVIFSETTAYSSNPGTSARHLCKRGRLQPVNATRSTCCSSLWRTDRISESGNSNLNHRTY
jgi:cytidyltransferase-like protein